MKNINKISDEKKGQCENCGNFTIGNIYGYSELNYFSVKKQFQTEKFFCSDECAEIKTGRLVI